MRQTFIVILVCGFILAASAAETQKVLVSCVRKGECTYRPITDYSRNGLLIVSISEVGTPTFQIRTALNDVCTVKPQGHIRSLLLTESAEALSKEMMKYLNGEIKSLDARHSRVPIRYFIDKNKIHILQGGAGLRTANGATYFEAALVLYDCHYKGTQ